MGPKCGNAWYRLYHTDSDVLGKLDEFVHSSRVSPQRRNDETGRFEAVAAAAISFAAALVSPAICVGRLRLGSGCFGSTGSPSGLALTLCYTQLILFRWSCDSDRLPGIQVEEVSRCYRRQEGYGPLRW